MAFKQSQKTITELPSGAVSVREGNLEVFCSFPTEVENSGKDPVRDPGGIKIGPNRDPWHQSCDIDDYTHPEPEKDYKLN